MTLRFALGALVSVPLLLGAGSAWAGAAELDRSDLMDLNHDFDDEDAGSDNRIDVDVREYETTSSYDVYQIGNVEGRIIGEPDQGFARLHWLMFEMDALDRSDKKLKMDQKDEVAWYAQFSLPSIGEYQSTFPSYPEDYFLRIEGCSASVKVKGSDGDPESAKWKFKCKDSFGDLLDELGLSSNAQDAFADAFGLDLNKKPKGKGKSDEPDPQF